MFKDARAPHRASSIALVGDTTESIGGREKRGFERVGVDVPRGRDVLGIAGPPTRCNRHFIERIGAGGGFRAADEHIGHGYRPV